MLKTLKAYATYALHGSGILFSHLINRLGNIFATKDTKQEMTLKSAKVLSIYRRNNMKIIIFKSGSGHWFFHVKSGNGKIICQSEGYLRKSDCVKTVNRLKENLYGAAIKVIE